MPIELLFPQRKLINIKEPIAKINRKQQSLREHIKPLFHTEVLGWIFFLDFRRKKYKVAFLQIKEYKSVFLM